MIKRLNLFLYLIIGIALVIVFCEIKNYMSIKEGNIRSMQPKYSRNERKKAEEEAAAEKAANEMIKVNNDNDENELYSIYAFIQSENLKDNQNILKDANN